MALILNTNIASLNATRNLANTQNQQEVTFKRLSTGLRINSAKDDAAGLYLAQSQTKDIRGLAMATRNAGDGISMAQTAEGALDQIGQNLQRINELAIQSANGTYNDAAREGLQKEVDELSQEIFRIVETTEFNGMKLLNQQADNTDLQISFTNENSSRVNVGIPKMGLMQQQGQKIENDAQAEMFGLPKGYQLPDLMQFGSGDLASGNALAKILGVEPNMPANYKSYVKDNPDNLDYYKQLSSPWGDNDAQKNNLGFDATAWKAFEDAFVLETNAYDDTDASTIAGTKDNRHQLPEFLDEKAFNVVLDFMANQTGSLAGGTLVNLTTPGTYDPTDFEAALGAAQPVDQEGFTLAERLAEAGIDRITNAVDSATGVASPEARKTEAQKLATELQNFGVAFQKLAYDYGLDNGTNPPGNAANTPVLGGADAVSAFEQLKDGGFQALKDAYVASKLEDDFIAQPDSGYTLNADSPVGMFSVADGLNQSKSINISNVADARMAITQTREAINAVSELRATFGAVMNRFEAVISGNNIYEENLTQARSRIQDTDFAKETANLAKQQVLQQAGIASLSQANQAGQVILNLL